MSPQSNHREQKHNSIGELDSQARAKGSFSGIDYLSTLLKEYYQQDLTQLKNLAKKEELADQDLETIQMIEDPITKLQRLLNIPPEISEYQQTIQRLNTKILILEDRLANSSYLVRKLVPLLDRNPKRIRSQLDIFKALQEELVIKQEKPKLASVPSKEITTLQAQVADLEAKINNPQARTQEITRLIENNLKSQVKNSNLTQEIKEEINNNQQQLVRVLSSLIAQIVEDNLKQDQFPLEQALTPILTKSFAQELQKSPREIAQIITPQIAAIIHQQISLDRQAMVQTLAPIIDQVIKENTHKDQALMTGVLAPILSPTISQRIEESPQEIARAIAPEMAVAIREQIKLEREAMIDALYPIMGETVAKAISQTIQEINQKLENGLSRENLSRRMRAKVQGVSQGELLLKESMPSTIRAVFLIQKHSGLVISTAYHHEGQQLESEMVAGMLTAIRSFVSEYIAKSNDVSEIHEIDYGNSQIILEVAGHCYLAAVIDGALTSEYKYKQKMGRVLSQLIQDYGEQIAAYEGNLETIPPEVEPILGKLLNQNPHIPNQRPPALGIIAFASIIIMTLLGFINQYPNWANQRLSDKITSDLESYPALTPYDLRVDIENQTVRLEGMLPNQKLKQQAQEITQSTVPSLDIENNIIALELFVNPLLVDIRLRETEARLNQHPGTDISTKYQDGKVTVVGSADSWTDIAAINRTIASIPGIIDVINQLEANIPPLEKRIYFKIGSTELDTQDINSKIEEITNFLKFHPEAKLQVIGHSNSTTEPGNNSKIATQRATAVKRALEAQGISPYRLKISAQTSLPPNVSLENAQWLSRCVTFVVVD